MRPQSKGKLVSIGEVQPAGREVAERLVRDGVCRSVAYYAESASTNTQALDELRAGLAAASTLPRLYLADRQTAGRGRHGRTWYSNDGSLTFSLACPWAWSKQPGGRLLSIVVGVALARAIETAQPTLRTQLKWPNDVYIAGGKVAGILIETCSLKTAARPAEPIAVIGIGLNVERTPAVPESTAAVEVRSLAEVTAGPVDRYRTLEVVVKELIAGVDRGADREQDVVDEFRQRCLLTGRRVCVRLADAQWEGDCQGVTADGELAIETEAGLQCFSSGEASLVRFA